LVSCRSIDQIVPGAALVGSSTDGHRHHNSCREIRELDSGTWNTDGVNDARVCGIWQHNLSFGGWIIVLYHHVATWRELSNRSN
jgi:hypothetical protein